MLDFNPQLNKNLTIQLLAAWKDGPILQGKKALHPQKAKIIGSWDEWQSWKMCPFNSSHYSKYFLKIPN